MLISLAAAKQLGSFSYGIAPIVAMQQFHANGLGEFGAFQASINPSNLSANGTDTTFGIGIKGGVEATLVPGFRVGFTATSPIWSQPFKQYAGLFANGGSFDIPASLQGGLAVDITPGLTAMVDYKRIFYSDVAAVGNPSTNILQCFAGQKNSCLGAANGPGFGWRDVDVVKFGIEWKATPALTLRGGYSWNSQPIQSQDVMLNILAPGVVQNHFTGGLAYDLTSQLALELTGMYAPRTSVTGLELPLMGPTTHVIEIGMEQYEVTAGIKYRY